MIQRNLRLKLVIGMLVSLSFAAPGQAKNVKVAIPSHDLTAIAFIAAAEKGYYREEGLDVELILMSAPIATLALVGGNVDFSVAAASALNSAVRGAPLRFLFHTYYRPLYWIYSKPEIREVPGLRGKRVGISGIGSGPYYLLLEVLRKHGLEGGRDVVIATTGTQSSSYSALVSGAVDATMLTPPWTFMAQEGGLRELISFLEEDLIALQSAIVVREALLQSDPAMVEKFMRGTVKGLLHARANRSSMIPLVAQLMKRKEDVAARTYDLYRSAMTPDGTVSKELQKGFFAAVVKRMQLKESPPLEKIVDYSLAQRVRAELEAAGWKPRP